MTLGSDVLVLTKRKGIEEHGNYKSKISKWFMNSNRTVKIVFFQGIQHDSLDVFFFVIVRHGDVASVLF